MNKREEYLQGRKESHVRFLRDNSDHLKGDMAIEEFERIIKTFQNIATPFFTTPAETKIGFRMGSPSVHGYDFFKKYPDIYFFRE